MQHSFFYLTTKKSQSLFLAFALFFVIYPIYGQGSEDFQNSNLTATYVDGSFVGNNSITWTYGHSRNEENFPIDGNGIMLRRGSDSYLEATLTGGVGIFSFQYCKAFTSASARQLVLIVNNEQVASTDVFGNATGADTTIYTFSHAVNTAGSVTIKIKDIATDANNRQAVLDNITWTAYDATELTANFSGSPLSILEGESVSFTDLTFGGTPTSWDWTFEGGTPATSTEQNPTVVYNTAGVYDVSLTVSDGTNANTKSVNDYITVAVSTITIFNQDWNDLTWKGWSQVSVEGDQIWEISSIYGVGNTPCAKMSGYANSTANVNEDWLISPSFNINNYSNVVLSFQNAYSYTGNPMELFFSNNFDGTNPSTATWQPLTYTMSSGSFTWTPSGDISLNGFSGTNCYIAFKYTSDATAASTWEVDDILLIAESEITLLANFSATPTSLMVGESVTFTDLSLGNPTSWAWTFEGGTPATSTEQNPIVVYNTAGVYDVQLVVTDGTLFDTLLLEDYILVNQAGQLICNNSFEYWTDGLPDCWNGSKSNVGTTNIVQYSESAHSGSYACQLVNTTTSHKRFTNQPTTLEGGVEYSITFWVRGAGDIRTALYDGVTGQYGYTDYNPYITVNTSVWEEYTQTVTAGGNTTEGEFIFSLRNTVAENGHLQIDDITITTSAPPALTADFEATPTIVFEGDTVFFTDASIGSPTSWAWTFEGGTPATSTEQNPTVVYNTAGVYDVFLTVSDGTNSDTKTTTDYITVNVRPVNPEASFSASATIINEGETVTFTNNSTGVITGYLWTFEGGTPATSTDENATVTYATAGVYDVQLVVTDGTLFDTLLMEDYILVNQAGQLICNNSFEYWTGGLPDCWNGSKSNVGTTNIVQYSESAHSGSYACQLVNTTTSHKRFTNQPTTLEGGVEYSITFWVRGAGDIRTALYDGVTGPSGYTDYNAYISVNTTEWEEYTQTVTAGGNTTEGEFIFSLRNTVAENGHLQIDDITIIASAPPALTADFEATPTTVFEGDTVFFTDASIGNPTSWAWTFEGGTPATSTQQNPIVIYNTAGVYDVSLTVSDGTNSDTKTTTDYITVNVSPVNPEASFSASATTINEGETVTFTNNSTGVITGYLWTFEGGTPATSTDENATVTYVTAGVYDVQLVVTDGTLFDTLLLEDYILVNQAGQLIYNNSFEYWTGGLPDCWNGSKSNVGTANIIQVSEGAHTGNFAVQLVNTTTSHKRFTNQPTTLEGGVEYSITFWVRGVGDIRTALYDGFTGQYGYTDYNPYITVNTSVWEEYTQTVTAGGNTTEGEFIFSLRNTVAENGHLQIDDITITASAPPALTADFEANLTTIQTGKTVQFTDLSTGTITSWSWIFEGGTPATSSQQNPIVIYNTAGVYDVSLTVSDGTNSDTKTTIDYITVNVSPVNPEASFSASATTINEGETVIFTNNSTGIITGYLWTFEGGTPATSTDENATVTYATAGVYDVQLVVTDGTLFDTLLMEDYILVNQAGQLICNNSFEYWTDGLPDCWNGSKSNVGTTNIVQYSESVHSGSYACQLVNTTTSHKRFTNQPTTLEGGVEYSITFWVRGAGDIRTALYDGVTGQYGYTDYNAYISVNTTEWEEYTQTVTAGGNTTEGEFIFSLRNTVADNGHLQIDDITITASAPPALTADFEATPTTVFEGDTVFFTDASIGSPTSWSWTFEGGTPATSTEQNPTVVYNTAGVYDVSLIVSDGTNANTKSSTDYITVLSGIVIFNQDWNDLEWHGWSQISIEGDQIWEISSTYGVGNTPCAKMSGYANNTANVNEDWLISPAFNISNYNNPVLSFQNAYSYTGNPMELFFSNNFDGTTPSTATWQPLTYTMSSGSFTWTPSGDISLNGFSGTNCYIAFKYTSDATAASTWEVDDILLIAESEITLLANFEATPTSLMVGESVTFTDLSLGNPTSWSWTFEGGTPATSTEQNPIVTYSIIGVYDVTLTISDGVNSNSKIIEDYITVLETPPPPITNFSANLTEVFVGDFVNFTDLSQYNPTSWSWIFNGGTPATSILQNPTVQYLQPGVFDVSLQATNEWGSDTELKSAYITVNAMAADFSASNTLVIVNGTSVFSDLTTGTPTGWSWNVVGPVTLNSTEQNPTFTFTTEGTYSVTLTAFNAFETTTITKTDFINVVSGSQITCNNSFEYWTDGLPDCWNGSKSNVGTENIVQYSESAHSGSYACQLINTSSSHKRFTNQPTTLEGGVEYSITFWVRGVGDIRTGLYDGVTGQYGYTDYNPYITVNTSVWEEYTQTITAGGNTTEGEFIFSLRNTVAENGHLQIDDINITASAPPALTADFEASATNVFEGTSVQFTDLSLGSPISWSWTFEGGTPSTSIEQNPSVIYNLEGTYDVILTVSNGTETDTKTIEDYITVFGGTIIFNQDWNDLEWHGWSQISVEGDQIWEISSTYGVGNTPCGKMSGYANNTANVNEDWLISPSFNINNYSNVVLSFQNAYSYTGNPMELFFSNNFDGTNPSTATWQPLTYTMSSGSFTWTPSGDISLDGYTGTNCYIAFKYTSDATAASTWEVDDILLISTSAPTLTANFYGTPTVVYQSETVTFTDMSTGSPTSWSWIFEGGTPATSTEQNPVITYNNTGTYDVTLTVSDGETTDIKIISDYITVIPMLLEPNLVITEIMYNPPESGTDSIEFIEIYNNDNEIVNLSGYKLTTAVDFTFPEVLLNPGSYIVISGNPSAMLNTFGVTAYQWAGSLNNTGEGIVLTNPAGTIINAVTYSKNAPWPTEANGDGYSLDLSDPDLDNTLGENWSLSIGYCRENSDGVTIWATPGAPYGYFFPMVDFNASETSVAQGTTVNFNNLTPECNASSFEWIFEGGNPTTATTENPSVLYEDLGTFDVTLTVTNEYGSTTLTKEDYITITNSINEIDGVTIKCYPNPTKDWITIETEMNVAKIYIYNFIGQTVLEKSDNTTRINVSNLESGVYLMRIISDEGLQHTVKLIKCE